MNLSVGDRAIVAFAAPCCGADRGACGQIVTVVEIGADAGEDYYFNCASCKDRERSVSIVKTCGDFFGLIATQRLVRLPPDEEMGSERRVIRRRVPA